MQQLQLVHESPEHLHTCLRSASLRDMVSDSLLPYQRIPAQTNIITG
ncbi:hypothetical protein HanXRQr2_Chr06g0269221 [Helianthus annuus]|uniref:Uncharacterized protein n=1 Tax=Helianthus annuus TaxID=4232 RepID=A0A9K3IUC2_HELAN|nr:hypothetical protein HanXRQr2_Chr06g0269221 [Helianthus annuus]KAJ0916281.1 hypothetical protein HanPSC8_Chr06g0259861 [Helianthus annuus]